MIICGPRYDGQKRVYSVNFHEVPHINVCTREKEEKKQKETKNSRYG